MRNSTGMALMGIFVAVITANETLPEDGNARLIAIGVLFALALVVLAFDGIRDRLPPPG